MRKQDHLLHLINSLEPNEKRYFKRFSSLQSGTQQYLKLFDVLEGKEQYEPAEIAKKLKITPAKLAHEKEYLQEVLLRSLKLFYEKEQLYTELQHELLEAQVLHNKYLIPFATSYTESLVERAALYEAYPTLLPAMGVLMSCYYIKGDMDKVAQNNQRIAQATAEYADYMQLVNLRNRLLTYSHTLLNAEPETLAAIANDPNFQRSQESITSFSGQLVWLDIQRTYLKYGNGDREKLLYFSEQRVELFEKFPQFKKAKIYLHYSALYMLATDYSTAGKNLEGIATIDKMLALYHESKGGKLLDGFVYTGQINKIGMLVYTRQYEAAWQLGQVLQQQVLSKEDDSIINLWYFHAIAGFHVGQYQEAFDKCEQINQTNTDAFLPSQYRSRILAGLCQYMLGNYPTAASYFNAAKSWGKRHGISTTDTSPLFALLEHLAAHHGRDTWKQKRQKLQELIAENTTSEQKNGNELQEIIFVLGLAGWVKGI